MIREIQFPAYFYLRPIIYQHLCFGRINPARNNLDFREVQGGSCVAFLHQRWMFPHIKTSHLTECIPLDLYTCVEISAVSPTCFNWWYILNKSTYARFFFKFNFRGHSWLLGGKYTKKIRYHPRNHECSGPVVLYFALRLSIECNFI